MKRTLIRVAAICMLICCFMLQSCTTVSGLIDNIISANTVEVTIEPLPKTVNHYSHDGSVRTAVRIDNITYEYKNESLCFYFTGEKTYDCDGDEETNYCKFRWTLYDSEGDILESRTIFISNLAVGDKFKDKVGYALGCVEQGKSYKIVISED